MRTIRWNGIVILVVVSSLFLLGLAGLTMADDDTESPVAVTDPVIKAVQNATVQFNGSASTDDVGVVGWNWTFVYGGGEVILQGPTPVFVFREVGTYTITLIVADAAGNIDETLVTVNVRDERAPTADAGDDFAVDQDTTVLFDGSRSTDNSAVVGWNWTFEHDGMGYTLQGEKPTFTFTVPGDYVVTLTVVDGLNLTDADTVTVTVRDTEPPQGEAGEDLDVLEGEEFTLDGSASTDNVGIINWTWTITDGLDVNETLHGETVIFSLAEFGFYFVELRVVDAAGNERFDQLVITVRSPDAPVADPGPDITVDMGDTVTFDGSRSQGAGITTYEWAFTDEGEQVILFGLNAIYVFEEAGVYTVRLAVTNDLGYIDSIHFKVNVRDTEPPVPPRLPDRRIDLGDTVEENAWGSTDNVAVINGTWTIVHGNSIETIDGYHLEFTPAEEGRYRITLTIWDAEGNEAEDTFIVTVGEEESSNLLLWIVVVILASLGVVGVVWYKAFR
jgi:PKD repeat protein